MAIGKSKMNSHVQKGLMKTCEIIVYWKFSLIYIFHNTVYKNLAFSSVQLLNHIWLFVTPQTAARQASLSITNSQSLLKLMSIRSVMSYNHLILCHPLFLLPSIFPSIRVSYSHQVAKVLEFQLHHHSFQWIFRTDFPYGLVGSPCSPRDSQESSPTPQFNSPA